MAVSVGTRGSPAIEQGCEWLGGGLSELGRHHGLPAGLCSGMLKCAFGPAAHAIAPITLCPLLRLACHPFQL
jgi:hypothetical protein